MAKLETIEINVKTNLKTRHVALRSASGIHQQNVRDACREAESDGMVLSRSVDAGGGVTVLVFVGGEDFLRGAGDA